MPFALLNLTLYILSAKPSLISSAGFLPKTKKLLLPL